jgi:hypothetical protein
MRLSPSFFGNGIGGRFDLAGPAPIIRAQLGPRSRGEAKRLARQLAVLCQTICSFAADIWKGTPMHTLQFDDKENDLIRHTVTACQNAITRALENPSQAIGLARGLDAALTSLQLVQREVAKGDAGASAVTANADALTRQALGEVLKLSARPGEALAAMAALDHVGPRQSGRPAQPPAAPPHPESGSTPLFSRISQDYIDMRIERDGENHPDIQILTLRRHVFMDVIGDRTPEGYYPRDQQAFVNRMQPWPANVTKRGDLAGMSTLEILEANKNFGIAPPMAKKTMADGYLANIRTMMRHGMQDHQYRDPFAGAKISYPQAYRRSKPREGVSIEVTNRVFRNGKASGLLDEAIFPLLAKIISRRLGLLTYLQGGDIRQKDGVWIAQTNGIVEVVNEETGDKEWRRVPIKTEESMTFYVLHNYLDEIGLISWMRGCIGFVFQAPHEHPDPSKYMSKVMQRLLKRSGARGGEVFHSLRGDAIDGMRKERVDGRARRLQSGHELGDVHDQYGFRALSLEECQRLANLPLQAGIDWEVFKKLDFDAMAKRRRTRGRRPNPMED